MIVVVANESCGAVLEIGNVVVLDVGGIGESVGALGSRERELSIPVGLVEVVETGRALFECNPGVVLVSGCLCESMFE